MSLARLIYYGAIVGGWAAFLGWLAAEEIRKATGLAIDSLLGIALFGGLVGACIGAGLNLLAGMANAQPLQQAKRLLPGLAAGAIGGVVGALLGEVLVKTLPEIRFLGTNPTRALGWMIMGAGIGVVEGLYERSGAKLRNGLIGGAVGGLVGGLLFDVIVDIVRNVSGGGELSSQATAFVILGLCIGVLIATAQVVFKQAWLTVVDGYRPKRELILSQPVTTLGRSETLPLPFFGAPSKHVEPEHARIVRQRDGRYTLEDNGSKIGTILNKKVIDGPVLLNDGDLIRLGNNIIRFHQKARETPAVATASTSSSPFETVDAARTTPLRPTVSTSSARSPSVSSRPGPSAAANVPPSPGTPANNRPAEPATAASPAPATARAVAPSPPSTPERGPSKLSPAPLAPRPSAPSSAPVPPQPTPTAASPTTAAPPRPRAPSPPPPAPTPTLPSAAPKTRPAAPPSPPASAPAAATQAGCPGCGKSIPGPVGKRYCPKCHQRF